MYLKGAECEGENCIELALFLLQFIVNVTKDRTFLFVNEVQ
jgi:hypothetical protein